MIFAKTQELFCVTSLFYASRATWNDLRPDADPKVIRSVSCDVTSEGLTTPYSRLQELLFVDVLFKPWK
jgi:hypothetical protein